MKKGHSNNKAQYRNIYTVVNILILTLVLGVGCGRDSDEPGYQKRATLQKNTDAGRQDRAREWFEKAYEAADLVEKERFYIAALEENPAYPEAHNNLGDVYEKQDRYEEAIREYELAATFKPGFSDPYFGLGDVYFKLGRYEQAAKSYEKGIKIKPNDKESQENLMIARTLSAKILFPFDSDELTNTAVEQLKKIAESLLSVKLVSTCFEIQGHTDYIGPESYNLHLSHRRAKMVENYLVDKSGVPAGRLIIKGFGEDRPIASNETREGRKTNRRVEFVRIGEP